LTLGFKVRCLRKSARDRKIEGKNKRVGLRGEEAEVV
jgi:hypothetical protein